jgi:hypothetical protein
VRQAARNRRSVLALPHSGHYAKDAGQMSATTAADPAQGAPSLDEIPAKPNHKIGQLTTGELARERSRPRRCCARTAAPRPPRCPAGPGGPTAAGPPGTARGPSAGDPARGRGRPPTAAEEWRMTRTPQASGAVVARGMTLSGRDQGRVRGCSGNALSPGRPPRTQVEPDSRGAASKGT